MKNRIKRGISLLMCLGMLLGVIPGAAAASEKSLGSLVEKSAEYMVKTVAEPCYGNIGGEWAVMGLARSGCSVPEGYYEGYYATVEAYVKECKGVLHKKKYTEYSRVIIGITAIGKDPTDVGGYDILKPLGDYEKTIWQGINGPIWALIALDSGNYAVPKNSEAKTQATRQMYVDEILANQLADGGWTLGGTGGSNPADPDMTGMALQALAKYQDQEKVQEAVERALSCLSALQDEKGGYASWGTTNSESVVQVIVGLTELGVSLKDERFVKNGHTLLENLLTFRKSDGSFVHIADGSDGSNQMATEQGFYGIVSALRAENGQQSLYRMSVAITIGESKAASTEKGLPGKNAAVTVRSITKPGTCFDDVNYEDNIMAIEALAAREIINGMTDTTFAPHKTMTRAEFATIIVKALGLTPKANSKFKDVSAKSWYAPYVGTANSFGIVNGVSDSEFAPSGTITRQEAATMVTRAAKLCGLDTAMSSAAVRDELSQFGDYTKVASWAKESMAFCYQSGILDDSALNIGPGEVILRCEIAQMVYNLLDMANLL